MENLQQHERFEIEVLQLLHDKKLLEGMIFGGGTALRLCYGLPRYSVDLDFWLIQPDSTFFARIKKALETKYTLTDAAKKFYSYLFELKSPSYPHRLKIEIRKKWDKKGVYEWAIAYSEHSSTQTKVKTFTLDSMFMMKKKAMLERGEIRDAYDLEYLWRRVGKPVISKKEANDVLTIINHFKPVDFKVKLGSLLPPKERNMYIEQKFNWLKIMLSQI